MWEGGEGALSFVPTLNVLERFSEECSILRSVPVQRYEGKETSDIWHLLSL